MILINEQQAIGEGTTVEEFRQQNGGQKRYAISPAEDTVVYRPADGGISDDHWIIDPTLKAEFSECPHCRQKTVSIVER